jgi:hypothetical protein
LLAGSKKQVLFRSVVWSCLLLKVPPLVPLLLGEEGEILLVPTRVAPPAPAIQSGIQGGSDKSGILNLFLENHTAQLKIIRFYKTKK